MMRQFPEYGIMAIGISLTMITGGIDLGVVGTANLSAILAAKFLLGAVPPGAPAEEVVPYSSPRSSSRLPRGCLRLRRGDPDLPVQHPRHPRHPGDPAALHRHRGRHHQGRPQSRLPLLYSKLGNTELFGFFPLSFILFP